MYMLCIYIYVYVYDYGSEYVCICYVYICMYMNMVMNMYVYAMYIYMYVYEYGYEYVWTWFKVLLVTSSNGSIHADALQGPVREKGAAKVLEEVCGGASPLCPGVEEDTVAEGLAAQGVDGAVAPIFPELLPVAIDSLGAALPPGPAIKEPGVFTCHTGQVIWVDENWPSAHKLTGLGRVRH